MIDLTPLDEVGVALRTDAQQAHAELEALLDSVLAAAAEFTGPSAGTAKALMQGHAATIRSLFALALIGDELAGEAIRQIASTLAVTLQVPHLYPGLSGAQAACPALFGLAKMGRALSGR